LGTVSAQHEREVLPGYKGENLNVGILSFLCLGALTKCIGSVLIFLCFYLR